MLVSPPYVRGGRNSLSAETARPLQFLRDKSHFMSNKGRMLRFSMLVLALFLCVCPVHADFVNNSRIIIGVRNKKLLLLKRGVRIAPYPFSPSKFGLGDNLGTRPPPLGFLQVAQKIGDNARGGAVFHNRRWTGEVLKPNAPG